MVNAVECRTPQETLRWASERFGAKLALVSSFQVDGLVLLDMARREGLALDVVTVDTGRLPQETHDLIELARARYGVSIHVYYPDPKELESFVRTEGVNPFYRSTSLRLTCCEIRKVNPLRRALASYDAWISGVRRDQSSARSTASTVEHDHNHGGILKINPLAEWTEEQVWEYAHTHDVPTNALYRRGYTSIGCVPCTRATNAGEDPRAGRWWWEGDQAKECGIHSYSVLEGRDHAVST